jgi:Mg2+-importing ATPase
MGASSNFGNMFSMLGGTMLLPFEPMLAIQILVNNLLYDFSQLGIPTDKVDEEYLLKPRKWNIDNVKKFMLYVGPISSIFDYATFALMWFGFKCSLHSADGDYAERLFHSGWFVESLLTQTMIVHIIRTNKIPFVQSWPSLPLALGTLVVMGIGAWLPYSIFANSLRLVPLPPMFWLWMLIFCVAYAFLCHKAKMWFYRKFGAD